MDNVEIQRRRGDAKEHSCRHPDHDEFDAPSTRSRTSVAVSETRGFDTLEAHKGLEHLLREAHPLERRALQRERDQGSIDVSLGSEHVGIKCPYHHAQLFQG